ncbi:hypothetical protein SEA_DUNCANSLEG_77 [Mycobacterium phage DuncansLeg]|nr:hypothetical protein SEA_DUNCANSLEG_77 [Mycobacterium phage DuncansLeg]
MPTISITPNGVQFPIPDCDAEVFYDPKTRTLLIEGLTDEDRITTRSDSRDGSQAVFIQIA